jgi:hypothetical protein
MYQVAQTLGVDRIARQTALEDGGGEITTNLDHNGAKNHAHSE